MPCGNQKQIVSHKRLSQMKIPLFIAAAAYLFISNKSVFSMPINFSSSPEGAYSSPLPTQLEESSQSPGFMDSLGAMYRGALERVQALGNHALQIGALNVAKRIEEAFNSLQQNLDKAEVAIESMRPSQTQPANEEHANSPSQPTFPPNEQPQAPQFPSQQMNPKSFQFTPPQPQYSLSQPQVTPSLFHPPTNAAASSSNFNDPRAAAGMMNFPFNSASTLPSQRGQIPSPPIESRPSADESIPEGFYPSPMRLSKAPPMIPSAQGNWGPMMNNKVNPIGGSSGFSSLYPTLRGF